MMMDMNVIDKVVNEIDNTEEYQMMNEVDEELDQWDLKGRNSKVPKKSNHGARPCSSVMRKLKKKGWYKKVTAI